jgi:hypothetical protein
MDVGVRVERFNLLEFDYASWADLANTDPASFFARRRAAIDALIQTASPSQQVGLRELQRAIDCTRARAGTPVLALEAIIMMLDAHLETLHAQLAQLQIRVSCSQTLPSRALE